MDLDTEFLKKLEALSALSLSGEEREEIGEDISRIMEYVSRLDQLDLEEVEPLSHPLDLDAELREDQPEKPLDVEETLANAPETEGQFFKVPKILSDQDN